MNSLNPKITNEQDSASHHEKSFFTNKTIAVLTILGILVWAGIILGIFYYKKREESQIEIQKSQVSAPLPTQVAKEEADISSYTIQVLNGSGTNGVASSVKNKLEETGFQNIGVGNSDSSSYKETLVALKKEVPEEVFEKIKETLKDYSVIKSETLEDDFGYDVRIIVGTKK